MKKIFLVMMFAVVGHSLYAMDDSESEDELVVNKEDIRRVLSDEADMACMTHGFWGVTAGIACAAGITASYYEIHDVGMIASALFGIVAVLMCGNACYDKRLPNRCGKALDEWNQVRTQRLINAAIDDEEESYAGELAV